MNDSDALPCESGQLKTVLSQDPSWAEADRALKTDQRIRKIRQLGDFFDPTPFQMRFGLSLLDLMNERIDQARREKVFPEPVEICAEPIKGKTSYIAVLPVPRSDLRSTQSSLLLAMPGLGKTRTTARVLSLFEQRLERDGRAPQIAWLQLHASAPADLQSFCKEFIQNLSRTSGDPRISDIFLHQNAKKDLTPSAVVQLAQVHSLGCLVIDDIQNMLTVDNGEIAKIRKLLKRLQDEAGVPVVLLGTLAGAGYVEGELETALTFSGAASDVWDRLPYDQAWDRFAKSLWRFQWTRTPVELDEALSERLYYHSQGIMGVAVNLYQRVQLELVRLVAQGSEAGNSDESRQEIITPEFIDVIAEWCFKPLHVPLDALRSKDYAKLAAFPDLKPLPSEARRLEAERTQAQQAEAGKTDPAVVALEVEDLKEATQEEIEVYRAQATQKAEMLKETAKLVLATAEIVGDKQEKILKDLEAELGNRIYAHPRKFMTMVERQIQVEERRRKRDEKRERRQPTEEDLDFILKPGADVLEALTGAGLGLQAMLAAP